MKKSILLGMGVCLAVAFSSCKSSESAYKKIYEKAKQNELAEQQPQETPAENMTPVVQPASPVAVQQPVQKVDTVVAVVREERVTVVSGHENGLKDYSVVCGSFLAKANAEGVKATLENDGYTPLVVYNVEKNTYRVIVSTFDDKASAAEARDAFKARYPGNKDFQKSWLLYRIQ